MLRRDVLKGFAFGSLALTLPSAVARAAGRETAAQDALRALERDHGGRLGVAVLDTGSGRRASWRGDERFLLCSTFKLLLAAAVLHRVDNGEETLERRIVYGKDAVLDYAPVTRAHVGAPGMTAAQLCEAAITLSDNTAANVLLANSGGPAVVTRLARHLGDPSTRLDRIEPALNRPDGDKDTTTPAWMLHDLRALLLGNALSAASRGQLTDWLLHCRTGGNTLRAGLPPSWRVGDKTGSGAVANNDVAILWPPRRPPLLVAAFYENPHADAAGRQAVLARVGTVVARL